MAFDENSKKRNLLVLFKFNGELNVLVPAIEIRKKLNSGVLIVKQGECVIDISKLDGWMSTIIHYPFSLEIAQKHMPKLVLKGIPWQHHQYGSSTGHQHKMAPLSGENK